MQAIAYVRSQQKECNEGTIFTLNMIFYSFLDVEC